MIPITIERLQRGDGFWVEEDGERNYYLPDDFMSVAQAQAYWQVMEQQRSALNKQIKWLMALIEAPNEQAFREWERSQKEALK